MVNDSPEHLPDYQARDFDVVDYQLHQLPGIELKFRGPQPRLTDGKYISYLGAAQTFGCFNEHPYPALLEEQLGFTSLNLGYGGAGPRFYNRHPELIEIVNRGQIAVVQVMSGRSEDNSRFESRGLEVLTRLRDQKQMSADAAWRSILEFHYIWKRFPIGKRVARGVCRKLGTADAKSLLQETRRNWIESYAQLLGSIRIPTVLFWFSKRSPDFHESFDDLHQFMGIYPQLVTREMVEQVAHLADHYIECITDQGSPQALFSRFDGSPVQIDLGRDRDDFAGQTWKHNRYYPSPEMHQNAANCLSAPIAEILAK